MSNVGNTPTAVEEIALEPCPFCGGDAVLDASAYGYCTTCASDCPAFSEVFRTEGEAATAWNRRAVLSSPLMREVVEVLEPFANCFEKRGDLESVVMKITPDDLRRARALLAKLKEAGS